MKINENILADKKYENIYSVEAVNELVVQGTPFREAYKEIGEAIKKEEFHPNKNIKHTHEGSIGNLCLPQIRKKMEKIVESFNFSVAENATKRLLSE
jgi:argininosuccinate lyase